MGVESRNIWRLALEGSQLLGLVVAVAALVISILANSMASESEKVAKQSLSVAVDSAQRYELTESFGGCFWAADARVLIGPIPPGTDRPSTTGQDRWTVLTNTGRLPVSIVAVIATLSSQAEVEVGYSYVSLAAPTAVPQTGPIYLGPNEAVALHTSYEVDGNADVATGYAYVLANGTTSPIEPKVTRGADRIPASVAQDFRVLSARDFDNCVLKDARPGSPATEHPR